MLNNFNKTTSPNTPTPVGELARLFVGVES